MSEVHAAQRSRERSEAPSSSAVDLAHRRHAPVLDQVVTAVGAEVGLGIADVDDEKHGAEQYGG